MTTLNKEEIPQTLTDRWLNVLYGCTDENNDCKGFIEYNVSYYETSLGFSGFLAGFEFLGVSGMEINDDISKLSAFLMTLSFVFLVIALAILIIQLSWIRSYEGHSFDTIKSLVIKYAAFIDVTAPMVVGSILLFAISVNVLVWSIFEDDMIYPIIINTLFGIGFVFLGVILCKFRLRYEKPWLRKDH